MMKPRWIHDVLDDEGMSVVELLIAAMIGVMVLTVAYLLFETGMKSFRDIENRTIAARSAQQSMDRMTRPMREMEGLSLADSVVEEYRIQFIADPNDDGNRERLLFYFNSAKPTNFMLDRAREDTSTGSFIDTQTILVADDVRNKADGIPMFTYLYGPGAPVTTSITYPNIYTARRALTHFVRITVVTRPDRTPTPASYTIQTEILMRNNVKL